MRSACFVKIWEFIEGFYPHCSIMNNNIIYWLQLANKSSALSNSKLHIRELENDLTFTEAEKRVDDGLQSEKWREFESLADGMKKLSRTMAHTSKTSKSPRSSVKFT